ncbi:MAG: hypothetical protein JW944_02090 [Deltaproteobacteria bacterium]|nr:hypothetical protein [Deltaproteobacteria bacterium]
MIEWMKGHEILILWMTGLSIITFVSTLTAVPWLVTRIPSHYFLHKRRTAKLWADQHPVVRAILLMIKNVIGYLLIAAGIIMLAIPGQGMLTILIGIVLIDIPGKYRAERWIVRRPTVLRSINWLRRYAGKAPLVVR